MADDVREALIEGVKLEARNLMRYDPRVWHEALESALDKTLPGFWAAATQFRPRGTVTGDKSLRSRIEQMVANQQSWIDAGRSGQVISRDAVRDALQKALDETVDAVREVVQ